MDSNGSQTAELLDIKQAADYLRISPGTISNWRCTGRQKLPCLKIGRKIFFRRDMLDKWLETRIQNAV